MAKVYYIKRSRERDGSSSVITGTLVQLVENSSYTLDCGASYSHEKGNAKINRKPKTIASLISNLNNAVNNSAADGYAGITYKLLATAEVV